MHPATLEDRATGERRLRVLHCLWSGELGGAERAVYQLVREQLKDSSLEPALLFAQGRGLYWDRAHEVGCGVLTLGIPHGHAVGAVGTVADLMRGFDIHHFHSAEPLLMLASARCRGACRVHTHRGGMMRYTPRKRLQYEAAGLITRRSVSRLLGQHGSRGPQWSEALPPAGVALQDDLQRPRLRSPRRWANSCRRPRRSRFRGRRLRLRHVREPEGVEEDRSAHRRHCRVARRRMRLLVIGDGPDHGRLETHARRLSVSSNVVFAGRLERPWDYVQTMDAFCLSIDDLESFGNAAVEAMALAVPTIVFADGGGLVEHVDDGASGFIVSNQRDLDNTGSPNGRPRTPEADRRPRGRKCA